MCESYALCRVGAPKALCGRLQVLGMSNYFYPERLHLYKLAFQYCYQNMEGGERHSTW